ncbi:MAG: hypothetical protein RR216_04765 [Pseudoflavonifractor sp.]
MKESSGRFRMELSGSLAPELEGAPVSLAQTAHTAGRQAEKGIRKTRSAAARNGGAPWKKTGM